MICNIVDNRTNRYNVNVDVVFQPSQHDNNIDGATQFAWGKSDFRRHGMRDTTIVTAVEQGQFWDFPVTLYLYDLGTLEIE